MLITQLPAATPTVDNHEILMVLQGGVAKKMTLAQALVLAGDGSGSGDSTAKTVSVGPPSGTPNDGDEWVQYIP